MARSAARAVGVPATRPPGRPRENRMPSLSRPLRLAFVHERCNADAKVVAGVAGAHQIVALREPGMEQTTDCLLAHAHGDRRVMHETVRELRDPAIELRRSHDLAEEAGRQRLLGGTI